MSRRGEGVVVVGAEYGGRLGPVGSGSITVSLEKAQRTNETHACRRATEARGCTGRRQAEADDGRRRSRRTNANERTQTNGLKRAVANERTQTNGLKRTRAEQRNAQDVAGAAVVGCIDGNVDEQNRRRRMPLLVLWRDSGRGSLRVILPRVWPMHHAPADDCRSNKVPRGPPQKLEQAEV